MRPLAIAFVAMLIFTACTAVPAASPSPLPSPSPSFQPEISPTPSATSTFYLRAWHSQALPPRETFPWLPMLTVADGMVIDGNVAVPAIYPGPLMITPIAVPISEEGTAAIAAEAERLGLLDGRTDFTGDGTAPGSRTAQLEMIVDGTTYNLSGIPDTPVPCDAGLCDAEPGSPAAFSAFWQELAAYQEWLQPHLGASDQYLPERIALLLTAPPPTEPGISPAPVRWPFDTPLAQAGVEFPAGGDERCVTLTDEALAAMLPLLQSATQLSVFVDGDGTQAGALARVLVPQEPSPCPDQE